MLRFNKRRKRYRSIPWMARMGLFGASAGYPSDLTLLLTANNGQLLSQVGPDYVYGYTAGQVPDGLGGVQSSAIPPVHADGYYGGPAYSNLFTTPPTGAATKTLTAQKYCLQCVGGSVAAGAYGTATPSAPLVFTASAGDQTFTPTGVTAWMLSAGGGYVFPIIPLNQSVVSTVGSSTGNGLSVPLTGSVKADRLIECFRGVPDGVELVTNGGFDTTLDWEAEGFPATITITGGKMQLTDAAFSNGRAQNTSMQAGDRLLIAGECSINSGTPEIWIGGKNNAEYRCITPADVVNGRFLKEFIVPTVSWFDGRVWIRSLAANTTASFDNISVQKLNPAVGTVAVLMKMGVGSTVIPDSGFNVLTVNNTIFEPLYFYGNDIRSYDDGTNTSYFDLTWDRNNFMVIVVEYAEGKFRIGKHLIETDSGLMWNFATLVGGTTFDGSFDPISFLRFFLNSTMSSHLKLAWVSNQSGLGDTEIIRRTHKYAGM